MNSDDIEWTSSIDGVIGKENGISVFLSEGNHLISAKCITTGECATIKLSIQKRVNENTKIFLFIENERTIMIDKGRWKSALYALNGSAKNVQINKISSSSYMSHTKRNYIIQRDIVANYNSKSIPIRVTNSYRFAKSQYEIGQEKEFFVLNTKNQMDLPHTVKAKLLDYGERWTFWIPADDSAIDVQLLKECMQNFENIILPRLTLYWGEWDDIDGDEKIAILASPSINEEKIAVGFFNQSDFFKKNTDIHSEEYNPYSNEMDIIYIATPCNENDDYSVASISATIAHELTHAITFSKKTFSKIKDGNINAKREDVFLEEGYAHLSETLCGFGESGGNKQCIERYAQYPNGFSLCGKNYLGQDDSIERRGAMTLFLSWIFWNCGGITWNGSVPVDSGGISFLQNMMNQNIFGWESIGVAIGKNIDAVFKDFIFAALQNNILCTENMSDKITGEKLYHSFDGFSLKDFPIEIILPYSFCVLKEVEQVENNNIILNLHADTITGSIFALFLR